MKRKLLVIAGPSGCGKNYMTDELIKNYPDIFEQLPQYTTRPKRTPDENTYYFITERHYDVIKNTLIAKTEINGYRYGTVPCMKHDRIGIIIANRMGIEDLQNYINTMNHYSENDFEVFFLGIDSEIPVKREDRSEEFIEQERKELKEIIDTWLYNRKERYLEPGDVINLLKERGFLF